MLGIQIPVILTNYHQDNTTFVNGIVLGIFMLGGFYWFQNIWGFSYTIPIVI